MLEMVVIGINGIMIETLMLSGLLFNFESFIIHNVVILMFLGYVLETVAKWKIFYKLGVKSFKAFVPFYNEYILYKKTFKTEFYWILLFLIIVADLCFMVSWEYHILQNIAIVAIILSSVIVFKKNYLLSKSFGHGMGYGICLSLFGAIFLFVLGFGKSTYVGNLRAGTIGDVRRQKF